MSEFDKEAEREKLREKYERDREKRKSTQVMSDLLLKGATMTNRHCDVCGDPIFRYDGQEFCPTCSKKEGTNEADGEAEEGGTGVDSGREAEAASDREATEPDERNPSVATGRSATAAEGVDRPGRGGDARTGDREGAREDPKNRRPDRPEARDRSAAPRATGVAGERAGEPSTGEGGLPEAHDSLVRTVVKFARAAEATDDPRRAREALSAAREAAETLEALRR
ncbi:MAG: Sjogren's syndrome/scleroderma autoantigen 1 family protein [Haloferacaceae archaeon]